MTPNFELGNYTAAEQQYQELAEAERSAPAVSRLARLAWVRGENQEAVALADEALMLSERLALRPNAAAFYWFQLGHFRFQIGDVPGTLDALSEAQRIAPGHAASAELLAFVYAANGDFDAAVASYAALVEASPAPDIHGSYADVLRMIGRVEEAEQQEELGAVLAEETAGRFPAERRHLANFYFTRDPALALMLAEADLEKRQDVEAYDTLAWALHQNGRHGEAVDAIGQALAVGTKSAAIRYHAAAIYAAVGDVVTARSHVISALEVNPAFHPSEGPAAAELLASLG